MVDIGVGRRLLTIFSEWRNAIQCQKMSWAKRGLSVCVVCKWDIWTIFIGMSAYSDARQAIESLRYTCTCSSGDAVDVVVVVVVVKQSSYASSLVGIIWKLKQNERNVSKSATTVTITNVKTKTYRILIIVFGTKESKQNTFREKIIGISKEN